MKGAGKCRVCGCTEKKACLVPFYGLTLPCSWKDQRRDLCTNPKCLDEAAKQRKKERVA